MFAATWMMAELVRNKKKREWLYDPQYINKLIINNPFSCKLYHSYNC
jgi:hypothetical protein